jgi:PAS domain S-box-containing protein
MFSTGLLLAKRTVRASVVAAFLLLAAPENRARSESFTPQQFTAQASLLDPRMPIVLRGTVTALWGSGGFFVQEGDAGIFVIFPNAAEIIRVNDRVEATGKVRVGGATPHLDATFTEVIGPGSPIAALELQSDEVPPPRLDARLVRFRGRIALQNKVLRQSRQMLVHAFGSRVLIDFTGLEDGSRWPELHPGELIEATGVLSVRGPNDQAPEAFRLLTRSRSEVVRIGPPPWWMPPRVYHLIGLSAILVSAVFVWAILLRRQVRHKTKQIRQRLELESALERRYRELFDSATDVILAHDLDGRITNLNLAGEKLLGWKADELIGRPVESIMAPSETSVTAGLIKPGSVSTEPGGATFRLELRARDERMVPFEVNSWLEYQDGEPVGVQAICRDISERLRVEEERARLERQLQETQKLESLGILAGGIAHDFNNLLTAVLGNASLARLEVPGSSPAQRSLEEIELAAERAAELCSQMLAYSGQGRFVISRVNLTSLVQETIELINASVSKRAKLELHLAEPLPSVSGDATQLRQIVMNLVINASESLTDGPGTVSIRTGAMNADPAWLTDAQIVPETFEGDFVVLEVSDTGVGMNPETLSRIFDPFFTTKFTGRGLGLAAVLGIVRGHRGALKVASVLGQGTTFSLALPAVGATVQETPIVGKKQTARSDLHATVLVVDDEASVRRTVTRALERMGCAVVPAEDGAIALDRVRQYGKPFDLVFLDLTMPQMDGVQTLRKLRRLRPNLPVILMSGFAEAHAIARFGEHQLAGYLQKPFTLDQLRKTAGRVLAESKPAESALASSGR